MANPDDILYAPINAEPWRDLCRDIVTYIENNRKTDRAVLSLNRQRPYRALQLMGFLEAFHLYGVRRFWRLSYPNRLTVIPFEFNGYVTLPNGTLQYPAFMEVLSSGMAARSIEDANLVPNTYTQDFIFDDSTRAWDGLQYLIKFYP